MLTFQGITWMAFAWFIVLLTGATRRRLAFFVTGAYALAVFVNILSPNSIIYATIGTLQAHYLPWNEKISYVSGSPNPWRFLADIAWILLIFMAVESIVRMAKRGLNRRAVIFGADLFIFLGVGYLHGTLMDLGVLGPPYITNLTFLALILVMNAALAVWGRATLWSMVWGRARVGPGFGPRARVGLRTGPGRPGRARVGPR